MTAMTFEPLHAELGVRITGIDLRETLDPDTEAAIRDAIDRWSFVCFPGQAVDDARQLELTRMLGEPEPNHVVQGNEGRIEYFGTIGNVQADGTAVGNSHRSTIFLSGNFMWHSDASFKPVPADLSVMSAHEVPSEGGETEFVSLRTAWDRQSPDRQAELEPLVAIHDYVYSRSRVAPDAVSPALAASLPPVRQRLVRTNPANGRKNLFLGSHAKTIEGWDDAKARATLDDLTDEATRPEHVLTHRWAVGDFVIWDNRCLIHRGSGYDADRHRRRMRQTRVRGRCSSLEE
ncbi:MAG: TauD/TfdA family dioxygenase [Pseudomonadota bacterium]|nr:TauD/TfdA family dioxygenase [Pseudomonadota bacterium]